MQEKCDMYAKHTKALRDQVMELEKKLDGKQRPKSKQLSTRASSQNRQA
jgi:hypothetical protein